MTRQSYKSKTASRKIFISWSGDNSKRIAIELKNTLEKGIFNGTGLECFVSDVDIGSGDDWWYKIKKELKKCKLGIVCITKENLKAPWIFFESGAMIARDLKVIPLLFNCDFKALNDTPISNKHMVNFYDQDKFLGMIRDINKTFSLTPITEDNLNTIAAKQYNDMITRLSSVFKHLKNMRIFNEKYIYPSKVSTVNLNTIFICAPMSSIGSDEYYQLRAFLLDLKDELINIGFTNVICPLYDNDDYNNFDGNTKAIKENFVALKQVDSMIVIYPHEAPSSVLVEVGYGLALCKKTVIFYRNKLPYILEDAGTNISHVDSRRYTNYTDIMHIIKSNGRQLFKMDDEE